jgi:hypothetical protein
MGYRYTTEDRIYGGSCDPRLVPKIVNTQLNAKLRPPGTPIPSVRETSSGEMWEQEPSRKARIGLPDRFLRK